MARNTKLVLVTCTYLIGLAFLVLTIKYGIDMGEVFQKAAKYDDNLFRIDILLFVLSMFLAFAFLINIVFISCGFSSKETLNWQIVAYSFFMTFGSLLYFGLSIGKKESLELAVRDQMVLMDLKYMIITSIFFIVGASLFLHLCEQNGKGEK